MATIWRLTSSASACLVGLVLGRMYSTAHWLIVLILIPALLVFWVICS
jgi:hypothetical protein